MTGRRDSLADLDTLIARISRGDPAVRDELVSRCISQIERLARRQLRKFPRVARWEQTDDIVQGVAQRLHRALDEVRPPTVKDLLRFCSELVRRELIDLKRRHFGPEGIGANHASPGPDTAGSRLGELPDQVRDSTNDPLKLAECTEVHAHIANLPEDLREVFDLIWYQELTQEEAAAVLGVSTKTIARRWRDARLRLVALLDGSCG